MRKNKIEIQYLENFEKLKNETIVDIKQIYSGENIVFILKSGSICVFQVQDCGEGYGLGIGILTKLEDYQERNLDLITEDEYKNRQEREKQSHEDQEWHKLKQFAIQRGYSLVKDVSE